MMSSLRTQIYILLLAGFAMSFPVDALSQGYTTKKEIILKNNISYAQVWGTSSLIKPTNLRISALSGDTLIAVKEWKYPTGNPAFKNLAGVQITFLASGKSLIRSNTPYNRNKLVEFLLNGFKTDLIVNNTISPEAEAAYISQFSKDALAIEQALDYEKKEAAYLKTIVPVKKDTTTAITVKLIKETKTPEGSIIQESEVYMGSVYLVSAYKVWTAQWIITFSRNIQESLQIQDKPVTNVKVATLTVPASTLQYGGTSTVFTNMDIKEQNIRLQNPKEAEKELVAFLIKHKYL
jgi:hypothetical protein